jgi:hypothetical protein
VVGVADQLVGAAVDLAHHRAHGKNHAAEGGQHAALRGVAEVCGQITAGGKLHDGGGIPGLAAQLARHAGADAPAEQAEDEEQGGRDSTEDRGNRAELPVNVVNVNARADDPAPRREGRCVGQLGLGCGFTGFREKVVHEAAASLRRLDHRDDDQLAVGILHVAGVGAFPFWLAREEDVVVVAGDDEHVVRLVVAHAADGFTGCVLCVGFAEGAGLGLFVEVLDDAARAFDLVLRLKLAVVHHAPMQVSETDSAQDDQSDKGQCDEQAHACGDAQVL